MRGNLLLPVLFGLAGGPVPAQFVDTGANPDELPKVPSEFEVTIFAREPVVRNPCSLAYDLSGRMFVGMGPQYRNPTPATPPDSVVIVEDSDGDGTADKTRVFAAGFNCIQGLAWHGRDLWVANAPDLTIVRDLDGDDVADEFVRVFTDLGNIEHGIHGLNWAPDGLLYMSKGNSKGVVIREWKRDEPDRIAPKPFRELWGVLGPPDAPDSPPPKTFTRQNYRSTYQDPADDWGRSGGVLRCGDMGANLEIVARGLRNPYDVAFDDGFDWLGTDQDQNEGDRIIMPFYGADFGWSHAWSTHWTGRDHLPTVPVSGPVFTGSGTGIVFADSPAWPEKFRKVWLINDWLLKGTQLYRPAWDGGLMQPQGGKWEDFIRGQRALYRPVDMEFGSDGALYILGWGRGYGVERDRDGNMTNEGRIFRVMPKGAATLPPRPADFAAMSVPELMAEFAGILPVRRVAAQDELVRRGSVVHPELIAALKSGQLAKAQETWTLWALARGGAADGEILTFAGTAAQNLKIQALRILGQRKSSALAIVLDAALGDPEPRIRFAAVQAVHQGRLADLANEIVSHAGREKDRVTFYAACRALRDLLPAEKIKRLLTDANPGIRCAVLLALLDLQQMPKEELQALAADPDQSVKAVALLGLGGGRSGVAPMPAPAAAPPFPLAANIVVESGRSSSTGVLTAGQPSYSDRPYAFVRVPQMLEGAFIIRTANDDDDSRGQGFLSFEMPVDATVIVAHDTRLKSRPAWLQSFADTDLTVATNDTTFRLWSKDFAAGRVTLGGNIAEPVRGKANYFVIIQPKPLVPRSRPTTPQESLELLGKANFRRGEALFFTAAACAGCHRIGSRGTNFGPDLTNLGDRMEAKFIVQSLLEPNAVITEGFAAHAVEAEGQRHFGMLLSTGKTLRLGLAGGTVAEIPADTITKHETLPVSPMPPQGALLGPQDVADITAWLLGQKKQPSGVDGFRFDLRDDRIVVTHSGEPVADYVFHDPGIFRPHFANLHAPGGIRVTRNHPPVAGQDATDHADLHPGLWFGFGDICGHDFWRNKARMEHQKFLEPPAITNGAFHFAESCRLLTAAGEVLGTVDFHIRIVRCTKGFHFTLEAAFHAEVRDLVFGDQEEMGLGARLATALTEKAGGAITTSDGGRGAAATWGKQAAWCDYSGQVDGKHAGIAIIPDMKNAHPCWWHNRDYGVFVANPFGRRAGIPGGSLTVARGQSLRLRFHALIHAGAQVPDLPAFVRSLGAAPP